MTDQQSYSSITEFMRALGSSSFSRKLIVAVMAERNVSYDLGSELRSMVICVGKSVSKSSKLFTKGVHAIKMSMYIPIFITLFVLKASLQLNDEHSSVSFELGLQYVPHSLCHGLPFNLDIQGIRDCCSNVLEHDNLFLLPVSFNHSTLFIFSHLIRS